MQLHRSTFHYTAHPADDTAVLHQIQELARQHPRYAYRRMSVVVNRSEKVNQQRIRRLWRCHRLYVRRVVRKRTQRVRPERMAAAYPSHIWASDFGEDARSDGTTLRILTVMAEFTRQGLAVDVALTTSVERVSGGLTRLCAQHGAPAYLRSDNGTEFVATAIQIWLAQSGGQTLSSAPGKPWQNGKEERGNGTLRDEGLNLHLCTSSAEACVRLDSFRQHYNHERPHRQLGDLTPLAFKAAWLEAQAKQPDPHIPT